MSTLSVPLSNTLLEFIDEMIRKGVGSNKAEIVRRALIHFAEDQAIEMVLRSEEELRNGKILRGDLKKIAKRLP